MSWKPDSTSPGLPAFNSLGNLPEGDYEPDTHAFERQFVAVAGSQTRQPIYEGWQRHCVELLAAGARPEDEALLNGSFTTNKRSPGDLDFAVEVQFPDVAELRNPTMTRPIIALLQGPAMKARFMTDAYPVPMLPPDDPAYEAVTERAVAYWRKWFGRDRNNNPKGRVWTTVGGSR